MDINFFKPSQYVFHDMTLIKILNSWPWPHTSKTYIPGNLLIWLAWKWIRKPFQNQPPFQNKPPFSNNVSLFKNSVTSLFFAWWHKVLIMTSRRFRFVEICILATSLERLTFNLMTTCPTKCHSQQILFIRLLVHREDLVYHI